MGLLSSAHDCSEGGLAVAVAESAIAGKLGAEIQAALPDRWDAAMFGESQSRIVVSLREVDLPELQAIAGKHRVPVTKLGTVGGDRLLFADVSVSLRDASDAWEHGFEAATAE
jgi:phosphoribosylformylglycinamidine synthase